MNLCIKKIKYCKGYAPYFYPEYFLDYKLAVFIPEWMKTAFV